MTILPFTFSQETTPNSGNTILTADLDVRVSPTDAIITSTNFIGGSSVSGVLDISNNSGIDVLYFISADWRESPASTISMATILANRLTVSVVATASPTDVLVFGGTLAGLVDRPAGGRPLPTATPVEELTFTVLLAEEDATNLVQGVNLLTDFVFVATQSPA